MFNNIENTQKTIFRAGIQLLKYIQIIIFMFPEQKWNELRNQQQNSVPKIHKYAEIKQHFHFVVVGGALCLFVCFSDRISSSMC